MQLTESILTLKLKSQVIKVETGVDNMIRTTVVTVLILWIDGFRVNVLVGLYSGKQFVPILKFNVGIPQQLEHFINPILLQI